MRITCRRPSFIAVGLSAALLVPITACSTQGGSGQTPPPSAEPSAPPQFAGAWQACAEKEGWECNTIDVPWDYENPGSLGNLTLGVVRHRAADQAKRIGALFWNPGGPGSNAAASVNTGFFSQALIDRFDLIAVTPRDTGNSYLPCKQPTGLATMQTTGILPSVTSQKDTEEWAQAMSSANRACAAEIGPKAGLVGTWQAAADLDTVRTALGEQKVTYLGYSYGGRLGKVYAHRFGRNLRAIAVDSTGSADGDIQALARGKAPALANRFRALELFCAERDPKKNCGFGNGPVAAYDKVLLDMLEGKLTMSPAVTPDQVVTLMTAVLANTTDSSLALAARALQKLAAGNATPLINLAKGVIDESLSQAVKVPAEPDETNNALVAINCADSATRPDLGQVSNLTADLVDKNPETALYAGAMAGICFDWPMGSHPIPVLSVHLETPALVIKAVGDPLADPAESDAWAQSVTPSTLLAWNGFQHGVSNDIQSAPCAADALTKYLLDPTAPVDSKACGV